MSVLGESVSNLRDFGLCVAFSVVCPALWPFPKPKCSKLGVRVPEAPLKLCVKFGVDAPLF